MTVARFIVRSMTEVMTALMQVRYKIKIIYRSLMLAGRSREQIVGAGVDVQNITLVVLPPRRMM